MEKKINFCTIYTLLWCFMHLKGVLYQSDIIAVACYGIVMLFSIVLFFNVFISSSRIPFLNALNALTFMMIIYGGINILFGGDIVTSWNVIPSDFYLKNALNSLLPIYSYYYFAKNGYITKKWIITFSFIFLAVALGRYYVEQQKAMTLRMANAEEVTNNAGYIIVMVMPLACFLNKRPGLQYAYLAICMVLIVTAMKRGAIIVGALCLIFFIIKSISGVSKKRKFVYLLLSVGIICVAYYFVLNQLESNAYFASRLNSTLEGNSSQRDVLYMNFFNMIFDRNLFYFIFGQGADATLRHGPNYAHNDWLEIGVNQGLIGIIIYAIFYYQLYKLIKALPQKSIISISLGMVAIILITKSLFSMSVNNMQIYASVVLGYAIACSRDKTLLRKCLS